MTNTEFTSSTHSLKLTAIAGEFVVSCFKIVDGVVDTDNEVFFRAYPDADQAARVFASKKEDLSPMKAAKFSQLCDWVSHCIASLTSCRRNEIPNESRILSRALVDLQAATLLRKNPELEARRVAHIGYATEALKRGAARAARPELVIVRAEGC